MWCFKGREGNCVYIVPNEKKCFGKSMSGIRLEGDPTISKLHAVVEVESIDESNALYRCIISDLSKYGTFVIRNGQKTKLQMNEKFVLQTGDMVQFGLKETIFTMSCISFVVVRSSLNERDAEKLTDMMHLLGGRLLETWEASCTHLTVAKNILFTTKLACALASAKPIVTVAYWEAIYLAVRESTELPDVENFLPVIKEEWLKARSRLLLPDEKRQTLFKGLSFVYFCAKQYFTYLPLITAAGGKSCVYPTRRPLTPRDLTARNAIVIQQPANDSSQFTQVIATDYPIIYHKLQAIKRRMISDAEIPLAILYCSTEMYCNSRFKFTTFLKSKDTAETVSSSDVVILEDTQDINRTNGGRIKECIIPETCLSQNNENVLRNIHRFDESAQRDVSDVPICNNSDVATKLARSKTDQRRVTRKVIAETYECSESDDALNKNVHSRNQDERRDMFVSPNTDICVTDFNRKVQKQREIIPESCCSLGKDASDESVSGKSDDTQTRRVVPDAVRSEPPNVNTVRDVAAQKVRQNIESRQERNDTVTAENVNDDRISVENVSVTLTDSQRENYLISEKDNSRCINSKTCDLSLKKNESLNVDSNAASQESLKKFPNSKKPRIVSIEAIGNREINVKRKREDWLAAEEDEEESNSKRKLDSNCNSAGRCQEEDEKTDNRIEQERNEKKKESRKMGANWYERFLNQEFTDELLRKDVPCGKKFTKVPVAIPKQILRMDDFVST